MRRTHSLAGARALADGWRPDAALVDGVLLRDGVTTTLGAPALVLSEDAEDGEVLGRNLDDGRGSLPKESVAADLLAAIDGLVGSRGGSSGVDGSTERIVLLGGTAVALGATLVYLLWLVVFQS